jgi:predicted TIM-barrel fold metal-dependent hydrolase
MSGIIDAHIHVWTPRQDEFKRVPGEQNYPPASFTPEEYLALARPAGIDRAVLIQMSFYGFDNSYMLKAMRDYPGVFSGVAVVDAGAPDVEATMRALKGQGVRGFRIAPGASPQTWLDTPGMTRMWRCGAAEQLAMCLLINPDALPSADRMCQRFPETPVVIDHLARIGVGGKIRDADVRQLCALAKHRLVYVKVSAFYALGAGRPPYTDLAPLIRRVFEDYGPRRLMWATDCPFQAQGVHTVQASVDLVRRHLDFLGDEDRAWMLERTAAQVYFAGI